MRQKGILGTLWNLLGRISQENRAYFVFSGAIFTHDEDPLIYTQPENFSHLNSLKEAKNKASSIMLFYITMINTGSMRALSASFEETTPVMIYCRNQLEKACKTGTYVAHSDRLEAQFISTENHAGKRIVVEIYSLERKRETEPV